MMRLYTISYRNRSRQFLNKEGGLLIAIAWFMMLLVSNTEAQNISKHFDAEISIGKGKSLYENINFDQTMILYEINRIDCGVDNLEYSGNANVEFIKENKETIYVVGLLPLLKYRVEILNREIYVAAGVGFNYINSTQIGNRNLGGHFIFSDMVGIGSNVFSFDKLQIDLFYYFRHISNAGIYSSNEGYNSEYLIVSMFLNLQD